MMNANNLMSSHTKLHAWHAHTRAVMSVTCLPLRNARVHPPMFPRLHLLPWKLDEMFKYICFICWWCAFCEIRLLPVAWRGGCA